MREYSRVTVVGSRRRIDLVLPSDETVGALTADLVGMLDEPTASPPLHRYLVTGSGDVLGGDTTLAAAEVRDGSVLRLVGEERLPPAPVVYDVAEETAADRDARAWLFGTPQRQVLGGAMLAAAAVAMAYLLHAADAPFAAVAVAAAAFGVAGIVLGRLRQRALAAACLATGVSVGLFAVLSTFGPLLDIWVTVASCALVVAVTPLLFALAGWRPRGALLGSGAAGLLLALWVGGVLLGVEYPRIAAVMAVVSVAVLGFLPRAALMISGVAALDDRRAEGHNVARGDVRAALSSAHEGLVLATVAAAASAGLAGVVLSWELSRWSVPLGCLLAFVLLSRSRVFPQTLQVLALVGAGVVGIVAFCWSWADASSGAPAGPLLVLAGLAALGVLAVALHLSEHAQARLRIVLDRLEMLAVIAMIPLVVGIFGTYSRLLGMY